ncbi:MAG: hypothetical protein AAB368_12665, partial [bacterium]
TRPRQPSASSGAAASFGVLGLGLAGLWYPSLLAILAAVGVARTLAALRRRGSAPRPIRAPAFPWRRLEVALPAALLGWLLLLICLAPEVFQDAMRYHLFLPKRFLLEHKYFFVDRYFFWSYMGLTHMLYGPALALGGVLTAHAVNLAMAGMAFSSLIRIMRAAGLPLPAQALAAGLTVTAPGLLLVTGSAFAEHGGALYVFLAAESLLDDRSAGFRQLRAAALWIGLAFTAKYTAAFGAVGCVLMLAFRADRGRTWAVIRARPAVLAVLLALPNAPWAVQRWLHTGDPVSPYLAKAGLQTLDASSAVELDVYYDFAGRMHHTWLAAPEELLRYPVQFAGAHAGFWEHPGPALPALILAAVLFSSTLASAAVQLLLFGVGSAGAWLLLFGGQ